MKHQLAPIPFLAELREEVLQRSLVRMPKWGFRLAADLVMQLQPKPTFVPSARAIEMGSKPRLIQFNGVAVLVEGKATAAMLKHLPKVETLWWQRKFEIYAYAETEWLFHSLGGYWQHGASDAGRATLDNRILHALTGNFFHHLSATALLKPQCLICGKGLTDPASMARWIGPECAGTASLRVPFLLKQEASTDLFPNVP